MPFAKNLGNAFHQMAKVYLFPCPWNLGLAVTYLGHQNGAEAGQMQASWVIFPSTSTLAMRRTGAG